MQDVYMPWRCFCVKVPSGLGLDCEYVLVSQVHPPDPGIDIIRFGGIGYARGFEKSLADLGDIEVIENEPLDGTVFSEEEVETINRELRMLGRLICGVCIEMSTVRDTVKSRSSGDVKYEKRNGRMEPTTWKFQLTRPVKIDVREAVKQYVSGRRGGKLSLQHLVRGHMKRQPYGPGKVFRKFIHIEPYWRGDEDAPIALRSHELGSEDSPSDSPNYTPT
jgi:hypothetical protein